MDQIINVLDALQDAMSAQMEMFAQLATHPLIKFSPRMAKMFV